MDDTAVVIAFWVLAILTIVSALMVALVRDLIHAVLFLILSFVGVAGLYITLSADFVAVVQVLIYAGAISVLMLFSILLTPRSARDNAPVNYSAPIASLAILLSVVLIYASVETNWAKASNDFGSTAREIGNALLDPYVLPFEVASVLLVVAMVGAIILVRPSEEAPAEGEQA
ncbi:MAG TPA: NADH-quinone oxidoreductase subunit J [Dehalococcoidia bacterium]|nr:NADH-quinone oxidoreductase subunit J [Dehalococcoidia bacterium]